MLNSEIVEELMEQQWLKIVNYENCNLLPSTIPHISKISSLSGEYWHLHTYIRPILYSYTQLPRDSSTKLKNVFHEGRFAALCIKIPNGNVTSRSEIIPLCQWIVGVLFNSITVRETSTLKEYLSSLDKLAPRLRSTNIPFPEVYTTIWSNLVVKSHTVLMYLSLTDSLDV
ncbi:uncharacterized protein LOC124337982 isoform X2 [Daphnia pulicaria]|uniref:uncharacterized protein LOC124337982 isoform X2 n=1 Tax=Daphnia pulicaria TaxID=35523 RepID=UPI001EEC5FA5|nr:uncharacterized protein LOC124337982 isoform X2 [Daphnia pulicaria]